MSSSQPLPDSSKKIKVKPLDTTLRAQDETIIRALCYADIFGFPLTLEEIIRFASTQITPEQVAGRFADDGPLTKIVKQEDEFFYLEGRRANCQLRRDREAESLKQLQIALRRLVPMQGVPFLRMAAITGALAAFNSPAGDDVDLLIISSQGRTWTTYFFLRLWRRFGHNPDICFNVFLTEGDLTFRNPNLFYAREILGSLPIFNTGAFEDFLAANPWVYDTFPSYTPDPQRRRYRLPASPRWRRRQKRLEAILSGPLGDLLEFAVHKIQARTLVSMAPDASIKTRRSRIKLHKHDNRMPIIAKYEQRLETRLGRYRELAGPEIKSV